MPSGKDTSPSASLPPLHDRASPILEVVEPMRPSRRPERRLIVGVTASMTAEQRWRAILDALPEWLRRYGKTLPSEVRAILGDAPIPRADASPDQQGPRGDAAVIGTGGPEVVRALDAVGDSCGLTSI
jgi:hypothetical protein